VFIRMELILTEQQTTGLDFASFKEAFEGKDLDRWLSFYAEEAEWTEYRHISPPRALNRMTGKHQIADFLRQVCAADFEITIADEVITPDRVAFSVDCAFPDGKHVFEHVIARIEDGKIIRQVDVEAWD
jgi:ketosteroid isomerase-like protein